MFTWKEHSHLSHRLKSLKTKLLFHSFAFQVAQDLRATTLSAYPSWGSTRQLPPPGRAEVFLDERGSAGHPPPSLLSGPRVLLPQLTCQLAPLWPCGSAFPGLGTHTQQLNNKKTKPDNIYINHYQAPVPGATVTGSIYRSGGK